MFPDADTPAPVVTEAEESGPRLPLTDLDIFVAIPHAEDRARVTWMLGKAGASACAIKSWPQLTKCGDVVERLVGPQHLVLIGLDPQPMVALAFAGWLREHGYERPILGLAATDPRIDPTLIKRAGCDQILRFPANARELVEGMLPHLGIVDAAAGMGTLASHSREPAFLYELSNELERHFCGSCPLNEVCSPGQTIRGGGVCPAVTFLRDVFVKVADRQRMQSRATVTAD